MELSSEKIKNISEIEKLLFGEQQMVNIKIILMLALHIMSVNYMTSTNFFSDNLNYPFLNFLRESM